MVCFDRVVCVVLCRVQGAGDQLVQDTGVDRCPVCGDLDLHGAGRVCLDEEDAGGGQVAPGGQPHVDDLPVLVDRPV